MPAGNRQFVRHRLITPGELNLDGRAVVAGSDITSDRFSISGANAIVVAVGLTFSAATRIDVLPAIAVVEGGTLHPWQWEDESSATPAMVDRSFQHAPGGADDQWAFLIKNFYGSQAQLTLSSQAGDASDTAVVNVIVLSA